MVRWNKKSEPIISKFVLKFLEILEVDAHGNVSTTKGFELATCLKILSNHIEIEGITNSKEKSHLLYRAFFNRLKRYRRQDIGGLKRALAAEARNFLNRSEQDFIILLPLQFPQTETSQLRSIQIFDLKLLFRSWQYVQKTLDYQRFIEDTRFQTKEWDFDYYPKFTPILVKISAKDYQEAFQLAERPFNFLRWLINLQYQFGMTTSTWGGYPKPLGKILPPPSFGIFNSDGSYETFYYTLYRYEDYARNSLEPRIFPSVRRLVRKLGGNVPASEVHLLLIQSLERYGEALDTFEWRLAFMVLWQILELITLQPQEQLKMKNVKARVATLMANNDLLIDLLDSLCDTRNLLVHEGLFPDEEGLSEVNLLKIIVERSINRLFTLLRICKTRASLNRYYQHYTSSNSDLKDRQRIIRNILLKRA